MADGEVDEEKQPHDDCYDVKRKLGAKEIVFTQSDLFRLADVLSLQKDEEANFRKFMHRKVQHEIVRREQKASRAKPSWVEFMKSPRHSKEKVNCVIQYMAYTSTLVMNVKQTLRELCQEVAILSTDWPTNEIKSLRQLVPYPTDVNYNPLANVWELDLPLGVQSQPIWQTVAHLKTGRMDAELYDQYKESVPNVYDHGPNAWPRKVKDHLTQIETKIARLVDKVKKDIMKS